MIGKEETCANCKHIKCRGSDGSFYERFCGKHKHFVTGFIVACVDHEKNEEDPFY